MRIVVDLQSCQTSGSKNRGIGRYSIALLMGMLRQSREHDIFVALNGIFPDAAIALREKLAGLLPANRVLTYDVNVAPSMVPPFSAWQTRAAQRLREEFLRSLRPDVVHVTSLFEGLTDLAVTDVPPPFPGTLHAVTLYDLIPLINREPYLANASTREWYYRKLRALKRADLVLAISSSSRQEAIDHVHIPAERVIDISSAIDPVFHPIKISETAWREQGARYGLRQSFIMYTGGIDHRKNIDALIAAFASLPTKVRANRHLAIICSITQPQREELLAIARRHGLADGDLVLTGYVPEKDLIAFYNRCELFVFPSLHEGFGLPALEAMACGAPTIGSRTSSIPEVIGREEALFDPRDTADIARKIQQALTDPVFAERLRRDGLKQSRKFSWDKSAHRALTAMEQAWGGNRRKSYAVSQNAPRLALVSPFPPARSGIADYSAQLLPELNRYYDVDLVTDREGVENDWAIYNCRIISVSNFEKCNEDGGYDRIIYHFGNSEFHAHMPDLLKRNPGVVVLHDFFLSGMQNWRQHTGHANAFIDALVESHGYPAVRLLAKDGVDAAIQRYPANGSVINAAAGVIVHSRVLQERLRSEFGVDARFIPLLRTPGPITRQAARERLKLHPDDILVCSFGIVAPPKLNRELVAAYVAAGLPRNKSVRLVFVGDAPGDYGKQLDADIAASRAGGRITATGFLDEEAYQVYLGAADLAVQLRTGSRGETSAAMLDALAHGVPLIVNAHGTAVEYDRTTVAMLDDPLDVTQLSECLKRLASDSAERENLGRAGRELVAKNHAPAHAGSLYHEAIEGFAAEHPRARSRSMLRDLAADTLRLPAGINELKSFVQSAVHNLGGSRPATLFVDMSGAMVKNEATSRSAWAWPALDQLVAQSDTRRVEPVYMLPGETRFRAARDVMLKRCGWSAGAPVDPPVNVMAGDAFLGLDPSVESVAGPHAQQLFRNWAADGIAVRHFLRDEDASDHASEKHSAWLRSVAEGVREIVAVSAATAQALTRRFETLLPARPTPLLLAYPASGIQSEQEFAFGTADTEWRFALWEAPLAHVFGADSAQIGTQTGIRERGEIRSTGPSGFLIFGPFLTLEAGEYLVLVEGTLAAPVGAGYLEVVYGGGQIVIGRTPLALSRQYRGRSIIAAIKITLPSACADLETRLFVEQDAIVTFCRLEIRPSEHAER